MQQAGETRSFEAALKERGRAMADACTGCGRCVEACPITGLAGVDAPPTDVIRGIVDIVRGGRNGFLVPPGDAAALADAIQACVENPDRARALGEQGRIDVENGFSWDVIADRLAALYASVV